MKDQFETQILIFYLPAAFQSKQNYLLIAFSGQLSIFGHRPLKHNPMSFKTSIGIF